MVQVFPSGSSYALTLVSHQTGLSVTATTANTFYPIGSAISITKSGILRITVIGHIGSGDSGYIQLGLTRGTTTYYLGSTYTGLFTNATNQNSFSLSNPALLIKNITSSSATGSPTTNINETDYDLRLPVVAGDSLQFYAANDTASGITNIDDLVVIEQ